MTIDNIGTPELNPKKGSSLAQTLATTLLGQMNLKNQISDGKPSSDKLSISAIEDEAQEEQFLDFLKQQTKDQATEGSKEKEFETPRKDANQTGVQTAKNMGYSRQDNLLGKKKPSIKPDSDQLIYESGSESEVSRSTHLNLNGPSQGSVKTGVPSVQNLGLPERKNADRTVNRAVSNLTAVKRMSKIYGASKPKNVANLTPNKELKPKNKPN